MIAEIKTSILTPKKASEREDRKIINLCEVCQKPTDYYVIEGDDGDTKWYCREHSPIKENGKTNN